MTYRGIGIHSTPMVTRRMCLKTVKGDDDYGDDYMQWRCRMMWMSLVVVVDRSSVCCYVINLLILDFLVVVRRVSSSFRYRRNGNGKLSSATRVQPTGISQIANASEKNRLQGLPPLNLVFFLNFEQASFSLILA